MMLTIAAIAHYIAVYFNEHIAKVFAIGYTYNGRVYCLFLHKWEITDFIRTITFDGAGEFQVLQENDSTISIRWKPHSKSKARLFAKYRGVAMMTIADFEKGFAASGCYNRGEYWEKVVAEYFYKYGATVLNSNEKHTICGDIATKYDMIECKFVGCKIASSVKL